MAIPPWAGVRPLKNIGGPVFQNGLDFLAELVRQRAVDQTMVEGERQVRLRSDSDGIAFYHGGHFFDCAHSKNRDLRLVDYRRGENAAKTAEVRDRECAALHFLRL